MNMVMQEPKEEYDDENKSSKIRRVKLVKTLVFGVLGPWSVACVLVGILVIGADHPVEFLQGNVETPFYPGIWLTIYGLVGFAPLIQEFIARRQEGHWDHIDPCMVLFAIGNYVLNAGFGWSVTFINWKELPTIPRAFNSISGAIGLVLFVFLVACGITKLASIVKRGDDNKAEELGEYKSEVPREGKKGFNPMLDKQKGPDTEEGNSRGDDIEAEEFQGVKSETPGEARESSNPTLDKQKETPSKERNPHSAVPVATSANYPAEASVKHAQVTVPHRGKLESHKRLGRESEDRSPTYMNSPSARGRQHRGAENLRGVKSQVPREVKKGFNPMLDKQKGPGTEEGNSRGDDMKAEEFQGVDSEIPREAREGSNSMLDKQKETPSKERNPHSAVSVAVSPNIPAEGSAKHSQVTVPHPGKLESDKKLGRESEDISQTYMNAPSARGRQHRGAEELGGVKSQVPREVKKGFNPMLDKQKRPGTEEVNPRGDHNKAGLKSEIPREARKSFNPMLDKQKKTPSKERNPHSAVSVAVNPNNTAEGSVKHAQATVPHPGKLEGHKKLGREPRDRLPTYMDAPSARGRQHRGASRFPSTQERKRDRSASKRANHYPSTNHTLQSTQSPPKRFEKKDNRFNAPTGRSMPTDRSPGHPRPSPVKAREKQDLHKKSPRSYPNKNQVGAAKGSQNARSRSNTRKGKSRSPSHLNTSPRKPHGKKK